MSRALEHLTALHRSSRGAGQTHALLAGAVAWAETAPRGVLRILVGSAAMVPDILTRLARRAPSAVVIPARREVLFPSGAAVRVVGLAEWELDGAGASGPVLLDGTAVAAMGDAVVAETVALEADLAGVKERLAQRYYERTEARAILGADVDEGIVAAARRLRAERDEARTEVERLRAENARLQRACDEGLPREYIECPACGKQHIEGPRHDDPSVDGRKRPHHTHRCYHCGHVWDSGRWSFGADVPPPLDPVAEEREACREIAVRRWLVRQSGDSYFDDARVIAEQIRARGKDGAA